MKLYWHRYTDDWSHRVQWFYNTYVEKKDRIDEMYLLREQPERYQCMTLEDPQGNVYVLAIAGYFKEMKYLHVRLFAVIGTPVFGINAFYNYLGYYAHQGKEIIYVGTEMIPNEPRSFISIGLPFIGEYTPRWGKNLRYYCFPAHGWCPITYSEYVQLIKIWQSFQKEWEEDKNHDIFWVRD